MNTNQTTQDHDIPSEADKNLYLMLANRRYNKDYLMPNIKAIRAAYSDKTVKGLIDRISDTNMASYNALTNFLQYISKQSGWTEGQKETLNRVSELYMDCAVLPFVTPAEKMDDLGALIDNFREGNYTVSGGELIDAIKAAPDSYNAQIYLVINTYMPQADEIVKKTMANAIEKLMHVRQTVGI